MALTHAASACRHDFVVVETIDFFDDEDKELPPPMTQRDVILLNRAGAFEAEEPQAADGGEGGEMEVRVHYSISHLRHVSGPCKSGQ